MLGGMKTRANIKPEILAPAGTREAMEAAVKAGCDAVYAGGSLFSARAYAGNFDEEAFIKAIDFCHLFGVKVYMTLNTLLKENEIDRREEKIARYLEPYYKRGLDAVLVQDMGVLKLLREEFPDLPVHASTQMSISSAYGARLAKELGMERIVPARELSLEEIRSIRDQSDIEIETFVHGAMCFAYSGKCLFSSFAGGRSGNRGRCAQPCRRFYELYEADKKTKQPLAGEYLLSLKDLCTLKDLPLLIDAGIDSFKIEGRMKNEYYVASAVSAYRRARDTYLDLKEKEQADGFDSLSTASADAYRKLAFSLQLELEDIYNRGGFYGGYYFTDKGREMAAVKRPNHQGVRIGTVTSVKPPQFEISLEQDLHRGDVLELRGDKAEIELTSGTDSNKGNRVLLKGKDFSRIKPGAEVWRTRNEELLGRISQRILEPEKTLPVYCRIRAFEGEPLKIWLTAPKAGKDGEEVTILKEGELVETAAKAKTSSETLQEKMKKSGGSLLRIEVTECEVSENAFVRMSSFNALRREAAEMLKEAIAGGYHRG